MSTPCLTTPAHPPELNIPDSDHTVTVRIIDSGVRLKATQITALLYPHIRGHDEIRGPSYSFLIENHSGGKTRRVVFDLGLRKDWRTLAPPVVKSIEQAGFELTVAENVSETLERGGISLDQIEAVMWSHWHWDHIGDPSTFPSTTDLVVGPGFKKAMMPGWPANTDGAILESDYSGRRLEEVSFDAQDKPCFIGRFPAIDYFQDGSFYLLDVPGHAVGHLCALARTTSSPPSFILMGADVCHHPGEMRPTQYLPLPQNIIPNPLESHKSIVNGSGLSPCLGSWFQAMHPEKSASAPFYHLPPDAEQNGVAMDRAEAEASVEKLVELDVAENIFVILAHDEDLLKIVDTFPKDANDWKARGWGTAGRWAFLKDFKGAIDCMGQS